MSRSSFFSRASSSRDSHDNNSLLPVHERRSSYSLQDLSPREARSPAVSPSPPPSFYHSNDMSNSPHQLSPAPPASLLSMKQRKIQFAAPPPPITASVLLPSKHQEVQRWGEASSAVVARSRSPQVGRSHAPLDPLLWLERKERAIQQELQILLDAQSTGLLQGFGGDGGSVAGSSDAGSSTPTSQSMLRSSSQGRSVNGRVMPVRQPKRKHIGLRSARRGLLKDMGELVVVKSDEVGILSWEIEKRNEALGEVNLWEKRIEGARVQLSGCSASGELGEGGGEDAMELAELRTEEKAVDNEIRELEDRLAQMKARKKWLADQIGEGVNRQEAKLSSYRGALKEAESAVTKFLRRPPVAVSVIMGNEEGFMALPPNRRTLGMAREWWNKEISALQSRKAEVEKEKTALKDGAELWLDTIQVVTSFEDDLRKQMTSDTPQEVDMLRAQIDKMVIVIDHLSHSSSTAEDKHWNLLICAIGAELEAFKEGEGILKDALRAMGHLSLDQSRREESFQTASENTGNGLEELDGNVERETERGFRRESSIGDSEDDGPNLAELLVERGHADSDAGIDSMN